MRFLAPAALAALAVGCSGDHPKFRDTYPVTGRVTHKGQPVGRAQLNFAPTDKAKDAAHATAVTAADGTFTLNTYKQGDGAPAGEYVVTVFWPDNRPGAVKTKAAAGEELAPNRLPDKYTDPARSPLRATVKAEPNDITLDVP
jgi:hypothetical protein